MPTEKQFLDEQGMTDLARKSIEVLRQEGALPTELRRLETLLKDGSVGEAFIMSSLLRTILDEISPEASQKKLLLVYRELEDISQSWWNSAATCSTLRRGSIIRTPDTILLSHTLKELWGFPPREFKA